jgi:transglutaminase-like putative cysteine protease
VSTIIARTGAPADHLTLRVGCAFTMTAAVPTPAVFMVRPHADGGHRVRGEAWESSPDVPLRDYADLYGNTCRRLTLPAGITTVRYDALVDVDDIVDPVDENARQLPVDQLPDDVLVYMLPSRFCLSDELADEAWRRFGTLTGGWQRVQAVVDFVHNALQFGYGSSTPTTTAVDALRNGRGVCRDYAHLAISFCRALNVPARYTFGYLPDIEVVPPDMPMDFCAWFEAYLDGRWWTFDPRNNQRRKGRVVIARGRDALDVAMVTSYGAHTLDAMVVAADRA